MTRLLDTHCHVDTYPDPRAVLLEAAAQHIDVVAVTESPESYRRFKTRIGKTANVRVALGLHPGSSAAGASGQLERFFRMLPQADWIGEIGLDYPSGVDRRTKQRQCAAFQAIVDHDLARTKPMTVHSRGAAADVVRLLDGTNCRAILHWFTGSLAVAEKAVEQGLRFSINPAMIRTRNGRALIAQLPRERVLCETDGPYCKYEGQPARSRDVREVVRGLASIWNISLEEASSQVADNSNALC